MFSLYHFPLHSQISTVIRDEHTGLGTAHTEREIYSGVGGGGEEGDNWRSMSKCYEDGGGVVKVILTKLPHVNFISIITTHSLTHLDQDVFVCVFRGD